MSGRSVVEKIRQQMQGDGKLNTQGSVIDKLVNELGVKNKVLG